MMVLFPLSGTKDFEFQHAEFEIQMLVEAGDSIVLATTEIAQNVSKDPRDGHHCFPLRSCHQLIMFQIVGSWWAFVFSYDKQLPHSQQNKSSNCCKWKCGGFQSTIFWRFWGAD